MLIIRAARMILYLNGNISLIPVVMRKSLFSSVHLQYKPHITLFFQCVNQNQLQSVYCNETSYHLGIYSILVGSIGLSSSELHRLISLQNHCCGRDERRAMIGELPVLIVVFYRSNDVRVTVMRWNGRANGRKLNIVVRSSL